MVFTGCPRGRQSPRAPSRVRQGCAFNRHASRGGSWRLPPLFRPSGGMRCLGSSRGCPALRAGGVFLGRGVGWFRSLSLCESSPPRVGGWARFPAFGGICYRGPWGSVPLSRPAGGMRLSGSWGGVVPLVFGCAENSPFRVEGRGVRNRFVMKGRLTFSNSVVYNRITQNG